MYRLRTLCLRVSDGSHFHGGENRDGSSSQRLHSRHTQQDRGGKVDLPAKAEVNLKFLPLKKAGYIRTRVIYPVPLRPPERRYRRKRTAANLPGTGPIQGKNRRLRMRIQFPPPRTPGEPPSSAGELRLEGGFLKTGGGQTKGTPSLRRCPLPSPGKAGPARGPFPSFLTILSRNRDIIPCRSPEKLV